MAKKFHPGDRVRLTGAFLRNTGQYAGGEGQSVWTVVAHPGCPLCAGGRLVAVNEPVDVDDPMYSDLSLDERRKLRRHIAAGNLIKTNKPDYSNL